MQMYLGPGNPVPQSPLRHRQSLIRSL